MLQVKYHMLFYKANNKSYDQNNQNYKLKFVTYILNI